MFRARSIDEGPHLAEVGHETRDHLDELERGLVLDQDGSLQEKLRVVAVPTALLIDPAGTIVKVQQGYRPGETAELERAIESMLAPAAAESAATDSTP